LYTATDTPREATLRARFWPITASPKTPNGMEVMRPSVVEGRRWARQPPGGRAAVQVDRCRSDVLAFEKTCCRCRQRREQAEAHSDGYTTAGRPVRHETRDISSQPISSQPISSGFAVPSWNRRVGRASSSRDRRFSPTEASHRLCRSSPTKWRNSSAQEGREIVLLVYAIGQVRVQKVVAKSSPGPPSSEPGQHPLTSSARTYGPAKPGRLHIDEVV